jgi:hypothetical protein
MFASIRTLTEQQVFEPAYYSIAELQFLLDHVGESPVVAMHGGVPKGVNPNMMTPTLAKLYEMQELQEKRGVIWAGVEAIKDSILAYLDWHSRSIEIKRRGGPRHPSMYAWEDIGKGKVKAIKYAPGSDAEMVRSRIDESGEQVKFGVALQRTPEEALGDMSDLMPWVKGSPDKPKVIDEIIHDPVKGFMQCSICGFAKNYNTSSHQSQNLAKAHVIKHLKSASKDVERHRRLHLRSMK